MRYVIIYGLFFILWYQFRVKYTIYCMSCDYGNHGHIIVGVHDDSHRLKKFVNNLDLRSLDVRT